MQAKYDTDKKMYMVLFRQIQMKQSQREKFEWVPLMVQKQPNSFSEHHIQSDYYRGFVSLDYFKTLDNTYSTGVKLRSKHLLFLTHEQSCVQISKQFNPLAYKQPEESKIEANAEMAAQDNESRMSMSCHVSKSAVMTEYSFDIGHQNQ